jgi:hypothetical protein
VFPYSYSSSFGGRHAQQQHAGVSRAAHVRASAPAAACYDNGAGAVLADTGAPPVAFNLHS